MRTLFLGITALALTSTLSAQEAPAGAPSPNAIVDAAAKEEWVQIDTEDLIVMTLAPDANGKPREVVIQLMPAPFSQGWVSNIRTLARAKWYDGISVNRVQDNYVVQWGDPGYDNPESGETEQKRLPEGLKVMGESDYSQPMEVMADAVAENEFKMERDQTGEFTLTPEESERRSMLSIATTRTDSAPQGWHQRDSYSYFVEFFEGWPIASDTPEDSAQFWPIHCYGMVGVGRNYSPDTGSGAELYTVIGHAPRHLDRNIALVGRIIDGMEHLSSLPRGTGELGFYTEEEAELRTPILSVRVVSDLAATGTYQERSATERKYAYEYLSTESETFAKYADARANRRDPFFIKPAGGADICNIPVPVRKFEYTRYEPLDGPAPGQAEAE
ncbi:peptidylprolyl isomerase [Erythrobacter sp. F6033]|uniref:peptidylprolyl isomerase n=1 Tax=Erythrobacter sp. F6033 TaxID=2926401 RepID=UPI001FF687C7|nr:peptidylprolyl isomerase [Erythrobacter sp. F6033]MCK0127510.1 peptidylprolyl isomerase [Erythrobacter sp. F6033]